MDQGEFSVISAGCLLLVAVALYLSYWIANKQWLRLKTGKIEKWILFWCYYDAFTHLFMEGAFVWLSMTGTVATSKNPLTILWKEYGLADKRWLHSDPTIVSLEILTVFIGGPLALILAYAIARRKTYRHFIQITLCVCELYGGWMTFAPEWLTGSPSLSTGNFVHLWVYLFFFNAVWVVIPAILLYHSWNALNEAFGKGAVRQKNL